MVRNKLKALSVLSILSASLITGSFLQTNNVYAAEVNEQQGVIPRSIDGKQLEYGKEYYMKSKYFPNRGGLSTEFSWNNWEYPHLRADAFNRGETVTFVKVKGNNDKYIDPHEKFKIAYGASYYPSYKYFEWKTGYNVWLGYYGDTYNTYANPGENYVAFGSTIHLTTFPKVANLSVDTSDPAHFLTENIQPIAPGTQVPVEWILTPKN